MLRLLTLISLLILSLATAGRVSASVSYTPGPTIAMTGSNSDVRFDVASALQDHQIANIGTETATGPTLNTENLNFSGAFYTRKFEWIEFSTGSYQVKLDCNGGNIGSLSESNNCHLTGTGWNNHIGEIDFSSVLYHPSTGLLSGSAKSFAGDIDLSGIVLPLRPVELIVSEITASSDATLTVSGARMHDGGNQGWMISVSPLSGLSSPASPLEHGVFSVDLSLAGGYLIEITDSNGSKTSNISLSSISGVPSTTLVSGSFYASEFCTANSTSSSCPDGYPRSATTLTQEPPTDTMVADGVSKYNFTLKPRDQYGNRVTSVSMKIKYTTTVKNIQSDLLDNINYVSINDEDTFISDELGSGLGGSIEKTITIGVSDPDITYSISSTAPTNNDNQIKLESIKYNDTDITLGPWKNALTFDPPFSANIRSLPPVIGGVNTFSGEIETHTSNLTDITPTIISTLQIGDGTKAEWHSLGSIPTATCTNITSNYSSPISSLCDWSGVSSIATPTGSDFTFTGTYHSIIPNPPQEKTIVKTYIHYTLNGKDILYNSQSGTLDESVNSTARVTILGGSSAGLGIGGQTRVDIINTLRERIFLLSRNRMNYDSADYTVVYGDYTPLKNNFFDTKRAIIVVGGDITITENIETRDHPLAIIALANGNNTGGNIIIADTVTDIHATLIAEHAIISTPTTTNQLYIHGSLISANPPRDIAPTNCPYFVVSCSQPTDGFLYDLPSQRGTSVRSAGGMNYPTPLVIESDPRLLSDPPPAMKK